MTIPCKSRRLVCLALLSSYFAAALPHSSNWRPQIQRQLVASLRGHSGAVRTVAFAPKKPFLLTGGDDGNILCWQRKALKEWNYTHFACGHLGGVGRIRYFPTNGLFHSWGTFGSKKHWDLNAQGNLLMCLEEPQVTLQAEELSASCRRILELLKQRHVASCIAMSPFGSIIIVGTHRGNLLFYRKNKRGSFVKDAELEIGVSINEIAFHPDGQLFATALDEGYVLVWHICSKEHRAG